MKANWLDVCSGTSSFSYTEIGTAKVHRNKTVNIIIYNTGILCFTCFCIVIVFAIFLAQINSLFLHFY
jgi:hypothetical protein